MNPALPLNSISLLFFDIFMNLSMCYEATHVLFTLHNSVDTIDYKSVGVVNSILKSN